SPWARRSRRRCYSKRLRSSLPSRRELGSRGRRRLRRGSWHGDRWGRGGSHDLLGRRDRTAVRLADDLAADDRPLVDEEPATFVDHIALDHAINFQVAAAENAYHVSVSRCLTRGRISRFRRAQACDPSHRSASRAAIEPKPAAVTACRYRKSWTSPAAKTPSTDVAVARPSCGRRAM